MKDIYRTIYDYGEDEIIINKSRFIGYARPISCEEEALDFIKEIKTKHKDATHNVYAYVCGEESNLQRFNDDGEPSGTAGIPALEVIKKEDLRNVAVVVTRYFGGVKLGGGGLIRAYTKGAKIALDAGKIVEMIIHTKLRIIIPYTLLGKLENFLNSSGYQIENTLYNENVELDIYIKNTLIDDFKKKILDITNGTVEIKYYDEKHLPLYNGKRI
jgi:uncharacterized YigZ family protein